MSAEERCAHYDLENGVSPSLPRSLVCGECSEAEIASLRVALTAAADGLKSAAFYLRHVNAFAFAEQVEIDERRARRASGGGR